MSGEVWVDEVVSEYGMEYYNDVSERGEFPHAFWNSLGEGRRFGLLVSRENGGSGISFSEFCRNVLEMSESVGALAYYFVAQNLSARLFDQYGSAKLRSMLPAVISGKAKVNLALTEEQSGADALAIRTRAVNQEDGSYLIEGEKYCVTNGKDADYLMVAARTSENKKRSLGITTFVLDSKPSETVNFSSQGKMGLGFLPLYSASFKGARANGDMILGEKDRAWYMLSGTFAADRLALGAMFIGMGRMAIGVAASYAGQREVFGRKIGSNQGIQFPLAEAYVGLEASLAYLEKGATLMDEGTLDGRRDVPMGVYYQAVNSASRAIDASMQTLGAKGYLSGPVEKLFRDIRYYRIGPISDQLALVSIAEKTLGLPGAGS